MLLRSSTNDNENSFYVNLLQVIDDNGELFLDVEQFESIDLCFKVVSESTLLEESNLRKAFSLFYSYMNQVTRHDPIRKRLSYNAPISFHFLERKIH